MESKKQVIWGKDFYQAAAYGPSAGILVFSITDTQSGCTGSGNTLDTGLYRLSKTDLQPVKISDLAPNFLEWSPEAGAFFALMPTPESSLIQITPDGKVSEPIGDMTELPVASPDGKLWAWMDSKQNLYVADPETLTPVKIAEDAQRLAWAP